MKTVVDKIMTFRTLQLYSHIPLFSQTAAMRASFIRNTNNRFQKNASAALHDHYIKFPIVRAITECRIRGHTTFPVLHVFH